MARAVDCRPEQGPIRLSGTLAAATVIGASASPQERLWITGADTVKIVVEVSAITNTPDIRVHQMLADAGPNDADGGTRMTTDVTTAVAMSATDTQYEINHTCDGERYLEIEIDSASGEGCTITAVDVFVKGV